MPKTQIPSEENKLSPMEREVRQDLVCQLKYYGLSNSSIARVMNLTESTASRLCTKCGQ